LARGALPAGEHTLEWNLKDDAGRRAPAGLYFVELEAEGVRITRRFAVTH
jgi:hypothetical protein